MRVDWFGLITALERAGISNARVALLLGVSASTVNRWKQGGEPVHSRGHALIELYLKHVPLRPVPSEIPKTELTCA